MRQVFKFLTSPLLLVHITLAIVLAFVIMFGTATYLDSATLHGEAVLVPSIEGKELFNAVEELKAAGLEYQILDSVYDESLAGGVIVSQLPVANQEVKEGRNIYLTINSFSPPQIKLPGLTNNSLRQALTTIQILGLEVERYEYKPDICKDCVLEVLYKDRPLKAGEMISRGAKVVLVLGLGRGNSNGAEVPLLIGQTFKESVNSLLNTSLNVGNVYFEKCPTAADSAKAVVYKQSPNYDAETILTIGSFVELWLTSDVASVVIPEKKSPATSDGDFEE